MTINKVSICIATHNMANVIMETIFSCLEQDYPDKEIIIYDDCSTDGTENLIRPLQWVRYVRGEKNVGVGSAFNEAIKLASGDFVVLMCADDLFTDRRYISDAVKIMNKWPSIGHVSRWYYQFVNDYKGPVRAWRSKSALTQANNPSGLVFRAEALKGCSCSNKMFVETTQLVSQVMQEGWAAHVIPWDAVAVRVWQSTSTQRGYWLKRRVSSPVMDQVSLGAADIAKDYVSLIQIKRGFTVAAVLEEICNFIKVRPVNLINPLFWFWSIVALVIPRAWAVCLPEFYRHRLGRLFVHEIKRPS